MSPCMGMPITLWASPLFPPFLLGENLRHSGSQGNEQRQHGESGNAIPAVDGISMTAQGNPAGATQIVEENIERIGAPPAGCQFPIERPGGRGVYGKKAGANSDQAQDDDRQRFDESEHDG